MNIKIKILFIAFLSLIFLIILRLIFHNPYQELKNINSKGKVIVAFGNSIAAGFGIDKSKAFPHLIEDKLGEKVINSSISGNTSEDALKRIEKDVLQFEPKIVLVELGGNDFLQQFPQQTTQINLEKIVDIIQKEGAIVILIGAPSLGGSLSSIYRKIAKEKKCAYINNILRGLIAHPSLMFDSIHPNEKGHKIIAERILKVLIPILKLNRKSR